MVVNADFDRIEQVLGNLLDNSLRHAPPESTIRIRAERVPDESASVGRARVSVEDAGPGIATEDLPHVFDRFYRSADETAGSGAGLGLAIAKQIILAHRGEIGVDSVEGGGTRFWFTLPVRPISSAARPAPATRTVRTVPE